MSAQSLNSGHPGPIILGLTGSIGMGKSTVAKMFETLGVPLFDADAAVRAMQGAGGALVADIEAEFPGSTGPEGVKRDALGQHVFGDAEALARLEAIIHPAVARQRAQFLQENKAEEWIVFDIPLLFEKGGAALVDQIIVVSASAEQQRQRVLARPQMTEEKFAHIVGLQTPDSDKRRRADHVIDTGCSLEETEAQVRKLLQNLRA